MDHAVCNQSVLVTGGAGFLGSHLVEELVPDNNVTVLDDLSTGRSDHLPDAVHLVVDDVREHRTVDSLVQQADIVFHLAGLASVTESVQMPPWSHQINASATVQVLDCARQASARVVIAGNADVYDWTATTPADESAPKRPRSPVAADALTADHYGRLFADLYELPVNVLRLVPVYGPRQSRSSSETVVDRLFQAATGGEPLVVYGDGSQRRSLVHVRDAVHALLRAATVDTVGEAFNVASGEAPTVLELAERVRAATDTTSSIEHVPPRPEDSEDEVVEIEKARTLLDYEPAVSLELGLAMLESSTTASTPPL